VRYRHRREPCLSSLVGNLRTTTGLAAGAHLKRAPAFLCSERFAVGPLLSIQNRPISRRQCGNGTNKTERLIAKRLQSPDGSASSLLRNGSLGISKLLSTRWHKNPPSRAKRRLAQLRPISRSRSASFRNSWNGAKNTNVANATAPAHQTMHPLEQPKLATRISVGKAVSDAVTEMCVSFIKKIDAMITRTISDVGSRRCVRRKSSTSAVNQSAPLRAGVRSNHWRYCHRRAAHRRSVRTRDIAGRTNDAFSCRLRHQLGRQELR